MSITCYTKTKKQLAIFWCSSYVLSFNTCFKLYKFNFCLYNILKNALMFHIKQINKKCGCYFLQVLEKYYEKEQEKHKKNIIRWENNFF